MLNETVHARLDALSGHRPHAAPAGELYPATICAECELDWPCPDAQYAAALLATLRRERDEGA